MHGAATDRAMTKEDTHLFACLRIPDFHGPVIRPADNVLAVRRVRHRGHIVRVPRQRALLLNPALWLALAWASTEATKQTILRAAVPARPL